MYWVPKDEKVSQVAKGERGGGDLRDSFSQNKKSLCFGDPAGNACSLDCRAMLKTRIAFCIRYLSLLLTNYI